MSDDGSESLLAVVSTERQRDYSSVIFRRCVLALVGSRVPEDTVFERDMLEELVMKAEQHLLGLISHLSRICHIQRRVTPSIDDVASFSNLNQSNVLDLEREAKLTPALDNTHTVATSNSLYFDSNEEDLPAESVPFFERPHHLVSSSRSKPTYIPSWMPSSPADHTYMHTESHSSQIRDLREVRVSLVEEGRSAERALQRLLGDKGSSSIIDLQPSKKAESKSMVIVDKNEGSEDLGTTRSTSLDIDEKSSLAGLSPAGSADIFAKDSRSVSVEPSADNGDDDSKKPRPLKSQSHVNGNKHSASSPTPPAESDDKRRLSSKLSSGKNKKKKEASILGKRPRSTDIVESARRKSIAMDVDDEHEKRDGHTEAADNDSQMSGFQAALSSFVR